MKKVTIVTFCFWIMFCAQALAKSKVMFIDSYHEGYAWSDGITAGIQDVMKNEDAELKIFRMDTKRNTSEDFKKEAAVKAKGAIESFKPDVVIAADDNASKYLIEPYYKNSSVPFVFCGVNWDASVYGYPYQNVTGMVEVTPIPQLISYLQQYVKGDKIGFLAPDLLTAKKEAENYKKIFQLNLVEYYAKDIEDYKKGYLELQQKSDMLILDSQGGLYDDKKDDLSAFIQNQTRIPSGTTYDFMAPFALITFAKIAKEQGQWAALAALKIIKGTSPSAIPIEKNKEGELMINIRIAKKLGIEIPYDLLENANKIIE